MTLIALHFPSMTASPPRHGGRHTHTEGATPSGQGSAFMRQSARGLLQVRLSGVSAEAVQRRPPPLLPRRAPGMVPARLRHRLRPRPSPPPHPPARTTFPVRLPPRPPPTPT